MTQAAQQIMESFDLLPERDRRIVASEILRRSIELIRIPSPGVTPTKAQPQQGLPKASPEALARWRALQEDLAADPRPFQELTGRTASPFATSDGRWTRPGFDERGIRSPQAGRDRPRGTKAWPLSRPSFSTQLWQEAGRLKAQWRRVSLADCFALALTIGKKGTLATSDHHELDRIAEAGLCTIRFIR